MQQQENEADCGVFAIAYTTHVTSVWQKPIIMFIQCVINETTFSQLPWKRNDVPIPKTGQHKESFKMQKQSTVTQYLLFMSFSMPMSKRRSNG